MEEKDSPGSGAPWFLHKLIAISERMLETDKRANIVIIVLAILAALVFIGWGVLLLWGVAPPVNAQHLGN